MQIYITLMFWRPVRELKPFRATGLFLYLLKISENLLFYVYRGYRKRPGALMGLNFSEA